MEITHNSGNALIVSTQRLSLIAGLSCLDVVEGDRMPQSFVCSEAKCMRRWEPTGHQMTCCGVVALSALGLRDWGERGTRREKGHWAPGALLKFTQPCCSRWDAIMLRPGFLSSIRKIKQREPVTDMSAFFYVV